MAFAVQLALVVVAALLLQALLARFVGDALATATALVWLWLPNHGALLHWTTATPITVALVLLLAGWLLIDAERHVLAALALGASVLCYEATAPAAMAGLVVVPLLRRRSTCGRSISIGAAVLAPVGVWMLANLPDVKDAGLRSSADLGLVVPAHVGWGVFPDGPVATVGGTLACVAVVLVVVDAARRRTLATDSAMVMAGVATIVVGTVPFVRYFYAPLGAGDRVNVVAGVGTALLWTGLGAWLASRVPRPASVAVTTGALTAMAVASWQGSMAWAAAADDAGRIVDRLSDVTPGGSVQIETPPVRRNVTAFADRSNIAGAAQLEAGTRDVDASLVRPGR